MAVAPEPTQGLGAGSDGGSAVILPTATPTPVPTISLSVRPTPIRIRVTIPTTAPTPTAVVTASPELGITPTPAIGANTLAPAIPSTLERPSVPIIGDALPRVRNALNAIAASPRQRITLIIILAITSLLAISTFLYLILRRR